MKKNLKRILAIFLVGLVGVSAVACSFEKPEWLEQAICDHVFDEEEIIKAPTCGSSGKKEKICSDCGKTEMVSIKATGEHTWDAGSIVDNGVKYTCTTCGKTKTEEAVAHIDSEWDGVCDVCAAACTPTALGYVETPYEEGTLIADTWFRVYNPGSEYISLQTDCGEHLLSIMIGGTQFGIPNLFELRISNNPPKDQKLYNYKGAGYIDFRLTAQEYLLKTDTGSDSIVTLESDNVFHSFTLPSGWAIYKLEK